MIDVTKKIYNSMGVYPGDPETIISKLKSIEKGYDLSKVEMSLHAGTHIDAPAHYIKGGKTIDEFPIIRGNAGFGSGDIALFRREINKEEAEKLAGRTAVGTSEQSIGSDEVHKILLSKGTLIIENLDLDKVEDCEYEMLCFPLRIRAEAAPCRCVLIEKG
jgi:arylformamidase